MKRLVIESTDFYGDVLRASIEEPFEGSTCKGIYRPCGRALLSREMFNQFRGDQVELALANLDAPEIRREKEEL